MKFIIFDIDGTLTDTKKVEDTCFHRAFERTFGLDIRGIDWGHLRHVTDWGITEEIIEGRWGRRPTEAEYSEMLSHFKDELKDEKQRDIEQFKEVDGARHFFNLLRTHTQVKLGIGTGSWEQSAKLKLGTIGIEVEGIAFSNSDYHKSREAITKDVIQQLQESYPDQAEEIIYFGDGVWDFKTCKNLGITFVGIDVAGDGKLAQLGAEVIFPNYQDVPAILDILGLESS